MPELRRLQSWVLLAQQAHCLTAECTKDWVWVECVQRHKTYITTIVIGLAIVDWLFEGGD